MLTWMRHLASTSCSLVWASSSSKCLSCSFSPSFSSSSGSVDVLSLLGDNACRDPRVLNRSLQWSQPITLLCVSTETHMLSQSGDGVYILYKTDKWTQLKTHAQFIMSQINVALNMWRRSTYLTWQNKHIKIIFCLIFRDLFLIKKRLMCVTIIPVVHQWQTRLTYCTWKPITLALKCSSLSSCILFQYNTSFQCNVLLQHIVLSS